MRKAALKRRLYTISGCVKFIKYHRERTCFYIDAYALDLMQFLLDEIKKLEKEKKNSHVFIKRNQITKC